SGAVLDLKVTAGQVRAKVAGSHVYDVGVTIRTIEPSAWQGIVAACGGRVDSLVSLLEGRIPDQVMRLVSDPERGLFPKPRQIAMTCWGPAWAGMCKPVAARFYGVGARLDDQPELLFVLRGVDAAELVHDAARAVTEVTPAGDLAAGSFAGEDLGALFG